MKLAFCLFKYYPYGGLERDFLRIAKACQAHGHEIHVYTMVWQGQVPAGFNIHPIPKRGRSNHRRAVNFAKQVLPQLPAENYDVVIGFNRMPGLDVYFAADLCFAKTAAEKHGPWFRYSSRYRNFYELEKALFTPTAKTKILTLTDTVKQDYQQFYQTPDERFIPIPAGVKRQSLTMDEQQRLRQQIRQRLDLKEDTLLLLQVASYFKTKGVDRSLRAIAALPINLRNKVQFYIIGPGKKEAYLRLAKKLAISNQVKFLGGRDDVKDYMLAADLLLHPAYFETAGMVLLEALTCALPITVSGNCGYAFHINKANAGIVLDQPYSQENFTDSIQTMLKDDLSQYQQNALNYANNADLYSLTEKVVEIVEDEAKISC